MIERLLLAGKTGFVIVTEVGKLSMVRCVSPSLGSRKSCDIHIYIYYESKCIYIYKYCIFTHIIKIHH